MAQQIRLLWWEVWSDTPQGSFLGPDLIHVFIDDLDEVGEVQCSDLWVDKPRGRPEGVGNSTQIPKPLNRLEPCDDPKRWCLKGTIAGPLAVS